MGQRLNLGQVVVCWRAAYRAAGRPHEALALLDRTIELARKLNRPHDEEIARAAREVVAESAGGPRPAADPSSRSSTLTGRGESA